MTPLGYFGRRGRGLGENRATSAYWTRTPMRKSSHPAHVPVSFAVPVDCVMRRRSPRIAQAAVVVRKRADVAHRSGRACSSNWKTNGPHLHPRISRGDSTARPLFEISALDCRGNVAWFPSWNVEPELTIPSTRSAVSGITVLGGRKIRGQDIVGWSENIGAESAVQDATSERIHRTRHLRDRRVVLVHIGQ